jgi:hypothetical protein
MAVGRISGPLLKANLERNGVNLAFDTNLQYLDVHNRYVGINTATPDSNLQVNGTTHTTNLLVDNTLTNGVISVNGNTISSSNGVLNLTGGGGDPVVYNNILQIGSVQLDSTNISTFVANTDLNFTANGSGQIVFNSNVLVNGNLHATGTITADGNLVLGNSQSNDTINIGAEFTSDIIPKTDIIYDIGKGTLRWNNGYIKTVNSTNLNTTTISATQVNASNLQLLGNTISSTNTNGDINLIPNGTGGVTFANFRITGSQITNLVSDAVSLITSQGNGYVQFTGQSGVVIPYGSNLQRPAIGTAPVGMMRFNTDSQQVEIYNGSAWTSVAGTTGTVSVNDATDIAIKAALQLG